MKIVVDNLLIEYEIKGSGTDVLLIHGWGDNLHTYDNLSTDLSEAFRVTRLDLPGFGQSEIPAKTWGLEDYATFVDLFCKKLAIQPKVLIGHSNGAAVAINGLGTNLLTADKLVVLAGAGIRDRETMRKVILKIIAKSGKVLTFWLPLQVRKKLQKKLYGAAGSDMLVVPHLQETFKKTVQQDVQRDASNITIPTLLIYGSADKATPPLYGEIYTSLIRNSRLEIIEGAEHFIHHQQPDKVARLIKDFIGE